MELPADGAAGSKAEWICKIVTALEGRNGVLASRKAGQRKCAICKVKGEGAGSREGSVSKHVL